MELKISSIADKGDLSNERIGLKVLKDCNLTSFIIFKTRKTNGGFLNKSKNSYWFLPNQVEEGDKVVLYSKKGKNSIKENEDGSSTYFFYWGLTNSIFNEEVDKIVLINAKGFKSF